MGRPPGFSKGPPLAPMPRLPRGGPAPIAAPTGAPVIPPGGKAYATGRKGVGSRAPPGYPTGRKGAGSHGAPFWLRRPALRHGAPLIAYFTPPALMAPMPRPPRGARMAPIAAPGLGGAGLSRGPGPLLLAAPRGVIPRGPLLFHPGRPGGRAALRGEGRQMGPLWLRRPMLRHGAPLMASTAGPLMAPMGHGAPGACGALGAGVRPDPAPCHWAPVRLLAAPTGRPGFGGPQLRPAGASAPGCVASHGAPRLMGHGSPTRLGPGVWATAATGSFLPRRPARLLAAPSGAPLLCHGAWGPGLSHGRAGLSHRASRLLAAPTGRRGPGSHGPRGPGYATGLGPACLWATACGSLRPGRRAPRAGAPAAAPAPPPRAACLWAGAWGSLLAEPGPLGPGGGLPAIPLYRGQEARAPARGGGRRPMPAGRAGVGPDSRPACGPRARGSCAPA